MSWSVGLAFFLGGFAGAGLLAYLTRGARDEEAQRLTAIYMEARRAYALLRFATERGLKMPEGADFSGYVDLLDVACTKAQAEEVAAGREH